jgi:hypothetical protein
MNKYVYKSIKGMLSKGCWKKLLVSPEHVVIHKYIGYSLLTPLKVVAL